MYEAPKPQALPLPERSRTYYFAGGDKVVLEKATHLLVSRLGNHRLVTADGKQHEIPSSFIHLEIDTDFAGL